MNQSSEAWHEWRLGGIGSSDAPVIMQASPYSTPYKLWEIKTGLKKDDEEKNTFIMDRGNELEPIARARYELENEIDMPPECCQHRDFSFLRASMDGWNEKEKRGLEIKFLGDNDFKLAESGLLPPRYFDQVMHQFLVTGADRIDFYGYNVPRDAENHKGKSVVVKVFPDFEYIKEKLWPAEILFWKMVQDKIAPPFIKDDYKSVRTKGTKAIVSDYIALAKSGKVSTSEFALATSKILELSKEHERARLYALRVESSNGVRIIKIMDNENG